MKKQEKHPYLPVNTAVIVSELKKEDETVHGGGIIVPIRGDKEALEYREGVVVRVSHNCKTPEGTSVSEGSVVVYRRTSGVPYVMPDGERFRRLGVLELAMVRDADRPVS